MKEQTPIEWLVEQICTDVEMYDDYGNVERIEFWNAFQSCTDLSKYINNAKEMEKERIQAKVLEALERDKLLAVSSEAMKGLLSGGKYYQNQLEKNDIAYHSVKIAKALIEEVTKQK